MTAHEVLVASRNLLDRQGWTQQGAEGFTNPTGTCAFLAPAFAGMGNGPEVCRASDTLLHHLGLTDLDDGFAWNDAPGRTKAEVLALYDRAIASTAPEPSLDRAYLDEDRIFFTTDKPTVLIDGERISQ